MCGISGWFSSKPESRADLAYLQRMNSQIQHRGPDGDGVGVYGAARFGHVRLAIIDQKGGEQPLSTLDGKVTITFNGEIYNYQSIRKELELSGTRFKTNSDTEVIACLYQKEGVTGFSKLRGMFAFALWDEVKASGFLVRDSLGIKPLFYSQSDEGDLYFCSEAKGLLVVNPSCAKLDESILHQVMNFRYIPGDGSLFKGIKQLGPGQIMSWNQDGTNHLEIRAAKFSYASIEGALRDAVNAHLISDVAVGTYLSGGVDSALVTALANSTAPSPLDSFTLNVGDDAMEAENAKASARLLGVPNHCADAELPNLESFRSLIWHLEVPKINSFQVYELSRLASQHVKVVLSGLGADELFTGYNLHQIIYQLDKLSKLASPLSVLGNVIHKSLSPLLRTNKDVWPESDRALGLIANLSNLPALYGLIRNVWDAPDLRGKVYGPRMMDVQLDGCESYLAQHFDTQGNMLERVLRFENDHKLVNDLLWQEDRCSMAFGLESRVPFVDAQLKATLSEVKIDLLMKGGRKKQLLKEISSQTLPKQILNRPKSGFQVDSPTYFHHNLKALTDIYLSKEYVRKAGLFNPRFVENVKSLPMKKKYRWHYFMLYLMIGSHVWLETFES